MCNPETEYFKNKQLKKIEIEQKRVILESKISRLMVVLTGACNLNCIMCERRASDFTLPQGSVDQIIDFFPYLDSVMWQGGEVFMVSYFKEFFQEASKFPQLLQEINTNGLFITEGWADIIAKTNTRLIFSIDSLNEEVYEYIRRGARFESLIRNITLLKQARQKYEKNDAIDIINIVVMRSNYQTLSSFVDFAHEYNFLAINLMQMIGDNCPEENIFHPPDLEAINYLKQCVPRIIDSARTLGINVSCDFATFLSNYKSALFVDSHLEYKEPLLCLMPWKSLFIDGSQKGKVYPECLCRIPVGDIFENSLEELWNNERMQAYRKKIIDYNIKNWCNSACINGLANKDFLQGT